jgi:hypothetical protein
MSTRPVRIHRSRKKGSRLTSPNGLPVVCVSRPSIFGNPWTVADLQKTRLFAVGMEAGVCVVEFRRWLTNPIDCTRHNALKERRKAILDALPSLRGKNLACWCPIGNPCHADVLLELANGDEQ